MARSRLSRQELIRLRRREGFVGRRGEIAAFRDNFARAVEDPAHQFLFHVHGQAGVGKTSLVRQFEETAREQGAPTAYVDEAVHDVPEAMAAIGGQLAAQGHPLKVFDKLLATYRERRHEAEAAAVTAEAVPGPADQDDPQGAAPSPGSMIAAQAGLAGLGLLPGVGALTGGLDPRQVARGADRLRGLLSARLRSHDEVQLVMAPLEVLTPVFVREVSAIADESPSVALFFDTYERTGPLLDIWLRDVLVSDRYGPLAPNVVVTLAGQTALDRRCWADCLDCVTDLPLDAFTEDEARQFLATRDITDERVVEVILRLSGGLPVLVSTLAENRPRAVEAVDDPSDTAVERFLKWETDPVRREAALAAALPRHVDEDIFRAVVDAAAAEQFGWLCGLPFVADRGGRWQYHEVVRTAMLRLQRRRSPQTWTARHRRLAEAARRHRTDHAPDENPADSWSDERQLEHRLREIYHSLCADPQPSLTPALSDTLDAAEHAPTAVRRVAETIRQAGEDAGDAEVRDWGDRMTTALTEDGGGLIVILTALLGHPGLDVHGQARIHHVRGREHRKAEAWQQAFADFDRCLELDPRNASALLGRGLTHRYMRCFERAAEDYTRALEITPDSLEAASQLGEAYRLLGRYEQAITEFDRALARQPRHAFSIGSRAVCLRRLGRHEEALAGLERAIEINANYAWAMAERGATYRDTGQHDLALAEFDRALAVNPTYVWAHARRGITLRVMGRHDEALDALGRAAELRPNDPWVWAERCHTCLESGRHEQAIPEADRALAVDPDYAWAHRARGIALHALDRHDEALAALDRSLELDADEARVWGLRGAVCGHLGRYEQALADLDRSIALDPVDGHTRWQRALALTALDRIEEARSELSTAVRLTPDSSRFTASRGTINLLTGRLTEALADFDRALELGDAPTHTLARRGKTHLLRGDTPQALTDLNRALAEADPSATAFLLSLKAGCLRRTGHLDAAREAIEAARDAMNSGSGGDSDAGPVVRYEAALLAAMLGGNATAPGAGAISAPVDGSVNAAASAFTAGGPWAALRADERFARAFGDGPSGDDRNSSTHTNLDRASALHGSNAPSAPTPLLETALLETALISTVSVAVLVRCALGDWSGAEARIADLLDGGSWEAVAETELGLRDLVRLPGADTERLEAIHTGLIRHLRVTAAVPE
ncbi:tetratricopeptide repeat protein [Streptomyces platensis]|uniref:tetratricopeptide repeat protein n=1 Tax=Streptomyces platensis TaxID=58346 RepID=UPI002E144FF0|nr:tetratricopeptide repeat protein [Streptomyces platensis]